MSCTTMRERLETVFAGREADRTPILGGWIACPEHICTITDISLEEYWRDAGHVVYQGLPDPGRRRPD